MHTKKYQVIWCLRQGEKFAAESFECILRYIDENCERIIIVACKEDTSSFLTNINKEDKRIRYISINKEGIYDTIWNYLRANLLDTVLLDSSVLLGPECVQKLQMYAYANRTIAGIVPREITVKDPADISILHRVLFTDMSVNLEIPADKAYHCLFLKGDCLDKLKKGSDDTLLEIKDKLDIIGEKIVKASGIYVGKIVDASDNNEMTTALELLKKIRNCNGKKNILYYLLADFQDDSWNHMGGTQLHVKDLTNSLKDKYNIIIVARDAEYVKVTQYIDDQKLIFKFYIGPVETMQIFYNEKFASLLEQILKAFEIDIVHVHHVMWMSLDIFQEAEKLGIPIIYTMHDYYAVCPVLSMLNLQNEVCTEKVMEDECATCLVCKKNIGKDIDYISFWREEFFYNLKKCTKIIVPSKSVKNAVLKYYPLLADKIEIIQHGIQLPDSHKDKYRKLAKRLKVAFIGDLGKQKGSETIYNLIKNGDTDSFEWYLIGGTGDNKLYHLKQKNLIKHGWYKKEELYGILESYQIDLICILSLVPETFCYTFSEAMACQIPVLVTNIGALGERIQENNIGWVVPYKASYSDILHLLENIRNDHQAYCEKLEALQHVHNISIYEMLLRYIDIYNLYPKKNILNSYNWHQFIDACETPKLVREKTIDTITEREDSLGEKIEIMKETIPYRRRDILEKLKITGKNIMERIMAKSE